jgi:hypothetical protein
MRVNHLFRSVFGGQAEGVARWAEPAQHIYRETGHELVLVYRGVTQCEIDAVSSAPAAFALVVEPPLLMLLFRFGDAIPWSVARCQWSEVPAAERCESCGDGVDSQGNASVRVCLVDAEEGRVCARRTEPISLFLSRAWSAAIRRLGSRGCSEARYCAALAQFSRRFPHANSLLSLAIATSVEGE